MSAAELKARLRADLKAAMQAKAPDEVRLLRALAGALDNAEAIPREAVRNNLPLAFGDPRSEVARRALSQGDIADLIERERDERLAAAAEYERLGESAEAARLRHEADLIARYRAA